MINELRYEAHTISTTPEGPLLLIVLFDSVLMAHIYSQEDRNVNIDVCDADRLGRLPFRRKSGIRRSLRNQI